MRLAEDGERAEVHRDPMPMRRLLLVDDHLMLTEALAVRLQEASDLWVAGRCAASDPRLPDIARRLRPDVITIEVEQLGASGATRNADFSDTMATSDDSDYRTHWQRAYGTSGGRYEDYDAAYRYGSTMAGGERYKNYRWEDAEPEMRRNWESSHPESAWDKVKDAVRYGAEKVTGRARH